MPIDQFNQRKAAALAALTEGTIGVSLATMHADGTRRLPDICAVSSGQLQALQAD